MFSLIASYLFPSDSTTTDHTPTVEQNSQGIQRGWISHIFSQQNSPQYKEALKKSAKAYETLTNHVTNECLMYCSDLLKYHAIRDLSFAYDERRWDRCIKKIENLIELIMEEMAICTRGICAGYLVKAGVSREEALKVGRPIEFEDIAEADSEIDFILKLVIKIPEKLNNYSWLQDEHLSLIKKVNQFNHIQCQNQKKIYSFASKKILEIYNRIDHIQNITYGLSWNRRAIWVQMSKGDQKEIQLH